LLKALKNFIENAIQHAKTSIKISLKQDKETGEIVFEIVDDGN
jgi:K+-sensing histidine kinase KdpD